MEDVTEERLGELAKAFNRAVDNLFLMDMGARHEFWKYIEKPQEEALYYTLLQKTATGVGPKTVGPADHITRAEVYAEVLTRLGRGSDLKAHYVPAAAKNEDVAKALETRAPSFARLCR